MLQAARIISGVGTAVHDDNFIQPYMNQKQGQHNTCHYPSENSGDVGWWTFAWVGPSLDVPFHNTLSKLSDNNSIVCASTALPIAGDKVQTLPHAACMSTSRIN